ncbi:MAG: hypothetical protein ACRECO_07180 [Xanthobacteraceae bacterium]
MAAIACRICCIEMASITLADGGVAIVCIDCDLIGLAHEVAQGARPSTEVAPSPGTPPARKKRPASKAA